MTKIKRVAPLAMLALSGCAGTASLGTAAVTGGAVLGQVPVVAGQVDELIPQLILEKYQALHNLRAGMEQIDNTPGPVTTVQQGPVIVPTPAPAPVPTPTPTPLPTGPTPNG